MPLGIGDIIPVVTFTTYAGGEWATITTDELFTGKRVVVFGLPGAFTPACNDAHLPGYITHHHSIKQAGIDAIYCVSVNDTFVMHAWGKSQGIIDEITMIPDGNAEFTKGMGMDVDKSALGLGTRSWRYAMVVKDGVIEKIFEEDRTAQGVPVTVTSAETILAYLSQ